MGEIGIPRREFLYDLRFWEVRRIVRGYRRRDTIKHQLLAECAYAAIYAMRDPNGKTVDMMFPDLFKNDDDDEEEEPPITKEDEEELIELIHSINAEKMQASGQ